jgi:hypothetical protein
MDLIDLVMTVCLISEPSRCHTEHLYFERRGGLLQCTFLAPPEIARWSEAHPKFRVVRWRCAYPKKEEQI